MARTYYDLTFICSGFAAFGSRDPSKIATETELWAGCAVPLSKSHVPRLPPQHLASAAVLQLSQMMISLEDVSPRLDARGGRANLRSDLINAISASDRRKLPIPEHFMRLCGQLRSLLNQRGTDSILNELEDMLDDLHFAILKQPFCDAASRIDVSIEVLAGGIASDVLRRFLLQNYDLAFPPFGSAGLLHAAAQLQGGLGAYFTDLKYWLSDGRMLLGLVQAAAGTVAGNLVERRLLERWTVLLSQQLDHGLLHSVIDEMANLSLAQSLHAVLDRGVRRSDAKSDNTFLKRIRDVGLDTGDVALAQRAQREWLRMRPDQIVEWITLGDVEATTGDLIAAAAAYDQALEIDPGNGDAHERLGVLRLGQSGALKVEHGYDSSPSDRIARFPQRSIRRHEAALSERVGLLEVASPSRSNPRVAYVGIGIGTGAGAVDGQR